jgi:hypothetical protein
MTAYEIATAIVRVALSTQGEVEAEVRRCSITSHGSPMTAFQPSPDLEVLMTPEEREKKVIPEAWQVHGRARAMLAKVLAVVLEMDQLRLLPFPTDEEALEFAK